MAGAKASASKAASTKVLAEARKRGKVIENPTDKQVRDNPGARGYDANGVLRPADTRAAFLVVGKEPEPTPDPKPEERATELRALADAERKAQAEKPGA